MPYMNVGLAYRAQNLSEMAPHMHHLDNGAIKPEDSRQSSLGISTTTWLQPKETALLMSKLVFAKEQFIFLFLLLFLSL